jgi:chorismate-pyruvate lyase
MTADPLYPLSRFCEREGHPLPPCEFIAGDTMPEPYRSLLVHGGDMTSRLEEFHGAPMRLRVLHRELDSDSFRREVLLCAQDSGLPVEYGAIEIHLDALAPELRAQILEGSLPLGGLLNRAAVRYRSEPRAFLKLAPDTVMDAHFGLDGAHTLYGRCNVLLDDRDRVLARIVEVLRP